jgi:hypothetical protein
MSDRRTRARAGPKLVWSNPDLRPFPRRRKIGPPRARTDDPWLGIPDNTQAGRVVLNIARAAGFELRLSSPSTLEFNTPRELPERLVDALTLHVCLNGRAICRLLLREMEEDENFQPEVDPEEDEPP